MFGVYLSLYIGTLPGRLFRQRFPSGRRFFNEIACISQESFWVEARDARELRASQLR